MYGQNLLRFEMGCSQWMIFFFFLLRSLAHIVYEYYFRIVDWFSIQTIPSVSVIVVLFGIVCLREIVDVDQQVWFC